MHLNDLGMSKLDDVNDKLLGNYGSSYHSNSYVHENNENLNDENFLQPSIGSGGEISMEVNKKYLSFTSEQVLCMCEALQQQNNIDK